MVNFPEHKEKRANFTSNLKKHVVCLHNSLCLFQMGLFYANNSSRTSLNQNIFIPNKNQLREKYFNLFTESIKIE